jgi:predicted alpha/beta superfamily hydrolase
MSYATVIRVHYPSVEGRIVLRTEADWGRDVEPSHVSDDRQVYEFTVRSAHPFLLFKPCLRTGGRSVELSGGMNRLAVLTAPDQDCYPHFLSGLHGSISDISEVAIDRRGENPRLRVYLPAGYEENTLKRYPVIYALDGRNLFFPEEAFSGDDWKVDETLDLLDSMSLIDQTIVAGLYTAQRERDYTEPGYERYARVLEQHVKPWVDHRFRTRVGPGETAILGSSLGGVAAFYTAWTRPDRFGNVACLSSTFGYRDDLLARVRSDAYEARQDLKIYLDSGWPADNYEATVSMAAALDQAGFQFGRDFLYFAFPLAHHTEAAWAARLHLPVQLFSGKLRRRAWGSAAGTHNSAN